MRRDCSRAKTQMSPPLLSGFGERRETTTAALVRRLVLEQPAWLAAVGAGGLATAAFALPECAGAPRTTVRKLVPLVNAPRLARSLPLWAPVGRRARRGARRAHGRSLVCAHHTHVGGAARHGRDGYCRARDRPAGVSMLAFLAHVRSARGLSRPSDVRGRAQEWARSRQHGADRGAAGRRARGNVGGSFAAGAKAASSSNGLGSVRARRAIVAMDPRPRLALALRTGIARTLPRPLRAIADGHRHQGPCWLLAVLLARRRPWRAGHERLLGLSGSRLTEPRRRLGGDPRRLHRDAARARPRLPVRHGPHGAAPRPPGVARALVRRAGSGADGFRGAGRGREPHIAGCVSATPPGLLTVTREAITEPVGPMAGRALNAPRCGKGTWTAPSTRVSGRRRSARRRSPAPRRRPSKSRPARARRPCRPAGTASASHTAA